MRPGIGSMQAQTITLPICKAAPSLIAAARWLLAKKLAGDPNQAVVERALQHAVRPLGRYRAALSVVLKPSQHYWQCPDVTVGTATLHAGLKSSIRVFILKSTAPALHHCWENIADVSSLMVKRDPLPLLADNG